MQQKGMQGCGRVSRSSKRGRLRITMLLASCCPAQIALGSTPLAADTRHGSGTSVTRIVRIVGRVSVNFEEHLFRFKRSKTPYWLSFKDEAVGNCYGRLSLDRRRDHSFPFMALAAVRKNVPGGTGHMSLHANQVEVYKVLSGGPARCRNVKR